MSRWVENFPHRRFGITLAALLVLLLVGTTGYGLIEGMSLLNALYMSVITLSTVGYGEVKSLSPVGKLFTIVLILGGGGLAMYMVGTLGEFFLSGEGLAFWKKRRLGHMLDKLANHVIVCGYGRVGRHVARELAAEGLSFVVIDLSAEKIQRVVQDGFSGLHGNAANDTLLTQAGIEKARGLVVAANTDAENVFIVLSARSVRPDLLIVARAIDEESESKLMKAGATRVIQPYRFSGRRMVTMLIRPEVANFLDEVAHSGGLELFLEQFHIVPASPLIGKTMGQAQWEARFGVTVLACRQDDGGIHTRPPTDTVLTVGMKLVMLGTRDQLRELTEWSRGSLEVPSPHFSHVFAQEK